MNYEGELNDKVELELLMDVSNILIGAILTGLSKQLDMTLVKATPLYWASIVMFLNLFSLISRVGNEHLP